MLKSLTSLWSCTANELAVRCCTSAAPDVKYVERRTEDEGLWFLAVTLADFGKSFQRWLDQGFVVPSDVPSFKQGSGRLTGLPAFMSGFLGRIFDPVSGVLVETPCVETVYAVRQLTLMFSKIALPEVPPKNGSQRCGDRKVAHPERERAAIQVYLDCENDVRTFDDLLDPSYMEDFVRVSDMLFSSLFAKLDRDVQFGRLWPKHGPGAVADRLSSNAKWDLRSWTARLQAIMPWDEFTLPNLNWRGEVDADIIEPGAELPVRVITVPKTLKTPRIIAIEPTAMQFAQQGLYRAFLSALEEDDFLYRTIGFDDQDPNRDLARIGSLSGELATLDMSEASDRVSNQHVLAMMQDFPHLSAAVQASRSRKADVPGHGVIRLAKFASMGSALCFPVEAMVFTTLIFLGIERELSTPLTREACESFSGRVRVFGDDLVVPSDYVLSVVNELSTFGCKVNVGKSYWTGRFRESCGREYFDGHDVSIVKVRRVFPTRRQDARGVVATVELRNLLYMSGLWQSAAHLDNLLRGLLKEFPNVGPDSPMLGRVSFLGYEFQKLHPNYQSPLVRGWKLVAKPPRDHLEGVGALHKCLSKTEPPMWGIPRNNEVSAVVDPTAGEDEHLERSGRPKHVSIKLGWGSPF